MSDLKEHIWQTPLVDTHEHQWKENEYLQTLPDVLVELFDNYVTADLVVAGASHEAVKKLLDASNPDVRERFGGVRTAWEACRYTGYGEAVRLIARLAYGIEEITAETLERAQRECIRVRQPGERLRILREEGNLDHVQVDDFCWACLPDDSAPEFFLYDISWAAFCSGDIDVEALYRETGVEVRDLSSLRHAMEAIFDRFGKFAIAVKAQHAYDRTLRWLPREDGDAVTVLQKLLRGEQVTPEEKLCLGDWCWARGAELAAEHNLPFKIHTGYLAGWGRMPVHYIPAGNLWELLATYPQTRFVLMHIAYPYNDELVALAKRYPNVYIDMCWAWSIDPYSAGDFLRRFLHAAPINKIFVFGGDTRLPWAAVAYATQARQGLLRALQAEVREKSINEREAMAVATRVMRQNQYECFDIEGRRANILHVMRHGIL
ncbi:MAG: amidohydrolase [Firmicutes bacterium]|nr:amidohydrolase [Bacillota bacterium]